MKRLPAPVLALFACASPLLAETPPAPAPGPVLPAAETTAGSYLRFVVDPGSPGSPGSAGSPGDAAASPAAPGAVPQPGGADRLQTAVVRFRKGGETVDLVAVVHLADAAYYESLNASFREYDAVLYEMVGGPHGEVRSETEPGAGEVASLRQLQQLAKGFLGLEFQLDGIDYTASNFVHADVAWDEMDALMRARNESFATLFTRAMALAAGGEIEGLPGDEAAAEAMMQQLFSAVVSGDSTGLKRTLAPFLSQAESLITQVEGEDGTVLVGERNRVAMEKLAELRASRGAGRYAIFYGAGHMPDFEKRLLAEGFTKGETVWLDAWTIGGPDAVPGSPPLETLLRTLTENPEVQQGLREIGTMLEQLGGSMKSLAPPQPVP